MVRGNRRPREEDGFSLIETLVALAILAMIMPALLGVLFTEVIAARVQRTSATADQVMLSVAEEIKADPYDATLTFANAATSYSIPSGTIPTGLTVTQTCWTLATPLSTALTRCSPPSPEFVQSVTITVTATTGTTMSVVVVKGALA